ncbi:hypothetical protein RBB79_04410 [Tunturiibacter empetritectus]|uniref:Uncharacterized protein n=2 Tax=Tunturiibacter TaxID=3154218 RepID=A0A852VBD5_9BACT|nr:hypothetical protein [Edaphobacter lichenicola]NYF88757.1 hypothetical protein [Edaphobacter lichenicola]
MIEFQFEDDVAPIVAVVIVTAAFRWLRLKFLVLTIHFLELATTAAAALSIRNTSGI